MSVTTNKSLFYLLIFFISTMVANTAFGKLQLKISMTHKLGIDNNLVLKSELHSIEEFYGKEFVTVKMKNGFHLKINAHYLEVEKDDSFGPTDKIQVLAELFSPGGNKIQEFLDDTSQIPLWKSQRFVYNGKTGQQIEIIVVPEPS